MCRFLVSGLASLVLVFGLVGGFSAIASAQDKPARSPAQPAKASSGSAYEKIMKVLDEPTSVEFLETPLKDVASALSIQHGINIELDSKAITDAGQSAETPITRILKGVSLRSALRLMLRDIGLDFVVADEVLLITSAEGPTELRLYDVVDLTSSFCTIDELSKAVRLALPPETVDAAKSNGASSSANNAEPIPGVGRSARRGGFSLASQNIGPQPAATSEVVPLRGFLLVRTTGRGHLDVTNMLADLRHRIGSRRESEVQSGDQDRAGESGNGGPTKK